jgi:hypothetical protein
VLAVCVVFISVFLLESGNHRRCGQY